jgi:hypothetical protein
MSAPVLTVEQEDDGSLELTWTPLNYTGTVHRFNSALGTWSDIALITDIDIYTYRDKTATLGVSTSYKVSYIDSSASTITSNIVTIIPRILFNCDCTQVLAYSTASELIERMLFRLGYAAVADNPPPGMFELLFGFLRDAQVQLSKMPKFSVQMERFFSWTMEPGGRYYSLHPDLTPDEAVGDTNYNAANCNLLLDPNHVTWVGFEDLNGAWYKLTKGIDPLMYTRAQISNGWPTNFEVRGCIEIFPAPQAAYTLWVRGQFGLAPFEHDSSDPQTTLDDEAVYLLGLAMAKAHYGQRDAQSIMTQAQSYIRNLVAGSHQTGRYIPRSRPGGVLTPPHFLPLDSE